MTPRLRVLLGGGGVGKTTLSASLAIAAARAGKRVGLLGIDPSRRLRTALGLSELSDLPAEVPGTSGRLHAAILRPEQTLRRWAADANAHRAGAPDLFANPFFSLLADGLAASTDALAAGRIVEWAEREPGLDELIVDTAPGLPALEFLSKPEKILALLDGRLLGWLGGRSAPGESWSFGIPRLLGSGLARLTGLGAFAQLRDLTAEMEACLSTFGRRVTRARDWLRDPSTELLLVASGERPEECVHLADALAGIGLSAAGVVLNRALPEEIFHLESARSATADERAFLNWIHALARQQRSTMQALRSLGVPELTAPRAALDSRIETLAQIGESLLIQLERAEAARAAPQNQQ